ncbi:MAG: hypothetical protein ACTSXQ_00440 [Alphaproteobacteria bacterium]
MSYDGTRWVDVTADVGGGISGGSDSKLINYGGTLFVAGYDTGTSTNTIMNYNGNTWTDIISDTGYSNFSPYHLFEFDGELFISGKDADSNTHKFWG